MYLQSIAHFRKFDQQEQTVLAHLLGTAEKCSQFAQKIALGEIGKILGILHDLGKYSQSFQNYIQSGSGLLNPDLDDNYIDSKLQKGKIDHSTAGAQWIWKKFRRYQECLKQADSGLLQTLNELSSPITLKNFGKRIIEIAPPPRDCTADTSQLHIKQFHIGLLTRFLFSCLIDADRIDSADFEAPENREKRISQDQQIPWDKAIRRLNKKLATFSITPSSDSQKLHISEIRKNISDACHQKASAPQGIFSLTVPTGGGKTLASMRFALHHAQKHNLDHIIYVIPYTSIIDQNAREIQTILTRDNDPFPWVLEHHSNLEPEKQTWHSKLSAENWDAPIIFTTMVQFLEALFGKMRPSL